MKFFTIFSILLFCFSLKAQNCDLNCGHHSEELVFKNKKEDNSTSKMASNTLLPQQANLVLGDRKVLFIRGVDPSTHTWQSNDAQIATLYTELDDYVRESSFNKAWIDTWDVTPIYNFATNGNTSYTYMSDELRNLAAADGYNLNDYNVFYYTYASGTDLNGAGALGSGDGNQGSMWMPSSLLSIPSGVIHETFHAFGTGHANDLNGGNVMFPGSATGGHDPYYFMGSQGDAGLDADVPAYFKYFLGWLDANNVIVQAEQPANCTTQRIYKTSLINNYNPNRKYSIQLGDDLWLSYEPDNNNTEITKKGVLLHYISNPFSAVTYLLDPLPESITQLPPGIGSNYLPVIDFWDAALEVGDQVDWNQTTIKVVGIGGTGDDKWVDIEFCDCIAETGDSDNDGVCDARDECNGFDDTLDTDSDFVPDDCDICPLSATNDSNNNNICDNLECLGGVEETFNYTATTNVNGNGGTGFSNAWTADALNGTIAIENGTLSNPLVTGSGNKMRLQLSNETSSKGIERDLATEFTQGETVWLSALIKASNIGDGGFWIKPNGNQAIALGKRWGTQLAIDNNGSPYNMSANQTYLLVAEYQMTSTQTIVNLWVNPTAGQYLDPNNPDATKTIGAISGINSIRIDMERYGDGDFEIDELKFSCEPPYGLMGCVPNTPCYDGSSLTINDMYDANCNCVGTPVNGFRFKALFEGFLQSNGTMINNLNTNNLLPMNQPFNTAPWNYAGSEGFTPPMTIPNNMVDWVLINAYDASQNIIESQAGYVDMNGNVFDVNGNPNISFTSNYNDIKYVSIHHKSHLAVAADATNLTNSLADFTQAGTALGIQQTKTVYGVETMYSGDFDGNGIVNNNDYNVWSVNSAVVNQYLNQDADGNGITNNIDYNLWTNNRSKVGNLIIQN